MSEGQRGLFQTVYLPTALLAFGQGVMVPVLPLYAKEFGGSYSLAGSVVAAAWLGTMLADLPTGMLLPRVGLRRAMVAGAGLFALATVGLGLVHAVLALLALRVVAGVGTAFWGLSRHAYIAQAVPPAARGRAISVFGGINRVGAFAGPFVGGYIGQIYGLSAALIVAGVLAGLAVVVALLFVQDLPTEARPSEHRLDLGVLREAVGDNRRDVAAAGLAQIFGQMVRAGRQTVVPLYGRYAVGLDAAQVGQIVSASALVDMSLFIPAGWLMDRFGRKAAAVPSFAIMAVGMALVPLTASYWTLLGAVLVVGFGNGIGAGTMMTLGADLAPPGRTGEFLGVWRLIGDSGQAIAPLVVGVAADALGLALTAGGVAGLGAIAASTLALLVRETRWAHVVPAPGPAPARAATPRGPARAGCPSPGREPSARD